MSKNAQLCHYQVHSLKQLNSTLYIAQLSPANKQCALEFKAGQYLEFLFEDDSALPFSIANKPDSSGRLEMHIRCRAGSELPARLLSMLKSDLPIRLRGPYGQCLLSENADQPLLFVATGTGFSQIGALIEQALADNPNRPIKFYFGAEVPEDLYADAQANAWSQQYQQFCYVPVVSDALPEHAWQGRAGWVQQTIAEDFSQLAEYQSYLCGQPEMIIEMVKVLESKGAQRKDIFADALSWLKID
ncbi:NAD(P)H-flavin reductase [Pelagibaculum spongiae]|uniref:FAD-binding FR-type domain-containing protein n=1 Tax=Pelagibaculum spongiae TaxID=2080658 RepID=A0A2V1GY96_9GAMM|nr:NAD(P)H-flavin reductase [Pelagibaculum spongiae]PVZ67705.1 hypothetical protein DC094_14825 [Pelagibaculum spongiae]